MKALFILAVGFGCWSSTSAVYGLWDLARQNLRCVAGAPCGYPLPFAYYVPWYIAGYLFVTMAFAGMGAFILGATKLLGGRETREEFSQLPAFVVASILRSAISENPVSKRTVSFPRYPVPD